MESVLLELLAYAANNVTLDFETGDVDSIGVSESIGIAVAFYYYSLQANDTCSVIASRINTPFDSFQGGKSKKCGQL